MYASDEEDGFVMIVDETTPLLSNSPKKNMLIAAQNAAMSFDKKKEHQRIVSVLDEYGVHDKKDSMSECSDCCSSLLKKCFGYDLAAGENQQMSVVVAHSSIIDFRNKKEERK